LNCGRIDNFGHRHDCESREKKMILAEHEAETDTINPVTDQTIKVKKKKKKKLNEIASTIDTGDASVEVTTDSISSDTGESKPKKKKKKKKASETETGAGVEGEVSIAVTTDSNEETISTKKKKKKKKSCEIKTTSDSSNIHNTSDVNVVTDPSNSNETVKTKKKKKKKSNDTEAETDTISSMAEETLSAVTDETIIKTKKKKRKNTNESETLEETTPTDESTETPVKKKKKKKKKEASTEVHDKEGVETAASEGGVDTRGGAYTGQWGSASLGSDSRNEKFLRLMGGFKASSQQNTTTTTTTTKKKFASRALSGSREKQLLEGLETQFEHARATHITNRGLGLGYEEKKTEIGFNFSK